MKNHAGYTLIELMVVLSIIGLMASVAVPGVLAGLSAGDKAAALLEQHNVQAAVMRFAGENGRLPANITEMKKYIVGDLYGEYQIDGETGKVIQLKFKVVR